MYQNPYLYNSDWNTGGQFLSSYPEGTLLGGTGENLSRPRPMYNVNPQHNLPTYGMDINSSPYKNNSNIVPYKKEITEKLTADENKVKNIIKDIINNESKMNNIIIIIMQK